MPAVWRRCTSQMIYLTLGIGPDTGVESKHMSRVFPLTTLTYITLSRDLSRKKNRRLQMKNMHIPDPGMTFLPRMDMTLQCWTKAIPVQQPQNSIFRTQSARILASNLPIHGNKSEPRVKHRTLQTTSRRWQSEWFFFYIPLSSPMKDEVILSLSLIKPFNCWDLWLSLSLRILLLLQSSRI